MNRVAKTIAVAFSAIVSLSASAASAATYITGDVVASTTWNASGSPYYVQNPIRVKAGATLTVDGATVIFTNGNVALRTIDVLSGAGMDMYGSVFTSAEDSGPGQWGWIRYASGALPSRIETSEFRHGGWGSSGHAYGPIIAQNMDLTVWGSDFHDNQRSGISAFESTLIVDSSNFERNEIAIAANMAHLTLTNSVVRENGTGVWFNYTSSYALDLSWLEGNEIVDNTGFGVNLRTSVVPAEGSFNRIANNNLLGPTQVYSYYTFPEANWLDNDFGDSTDCVCPFAPVPIQTHKAKGGTACITTNKAPPEGRITSNVYHLVVDSKTTLYCRADHLRTF